MKPEDAISLIRYEYSQPAKKQVWADLGCGSGTFTLALAYHLPEGSVIHAIDKNKSSLDRIPSQYRNITIRKKHGDFLEEKLSENFDGILMANSLHYVRNKISFIGKIEGYLKNDGNFLIVEYDTNIPNPWVPFPVSYNSLKKLFEKAGYSLVQKLGETHSLYRRAKIYSALIKKSK